MGSRSENVAARTGGFTLIELMVAFLLLDLAILAYVSVEVTKIRTNAVAFQRRLAWSRVLRKVQELSLENAQSSPELTVTPFPATSSDTYHSFVQQYGGITYTVYWTANTESQLEASSGWPFNPPANMVWISVWAQWTSYGVTHRIPPHIFAMPS